MIYNSWDKDRDRLKLVILGHFLPFYPRPSPLKSTKVKFWKIGKHCWIYHPKITISWDTEWDRMDVLSFWAYFCPFTSLIILKTKYLKKWKWKKVPGDFILLHMCTINEDHMIYGSWNSWNIRCNRQIFLSFLAIFCLFNPPPPPSPTWWPVITKFWNIGKNNWRYYHFTHVRHEWQSHDVSFLSEWDMECNGQNLLSLWTSDWYYFYFSFFAIFCSFAPPNDPIKQN